MTRRRLLWASVVFGVAGFGVLAAAGPAFAYLPSGRAPTYSGAINNVPWPIYGFAGAPTATFGSVGFMCNEMIYDAEQAQVSQSWGGAFQCSGVVSSLSSVTDVTIGYPQCGSQSCSNTGYYGWGLIDPFAGAPPSSCSGGGVPVGGSGNTSVVWSEGISTSGTKVCGVANSQGIVTGGCGDASFNAALCLNVSSLTEGTRALASNGSYYYGVYITGGWSYTVPPPGHTWAGDTPVPVAHESAIPTSGQSSGIVMGSTADLIGGVTYSSSQTNATAVQYWFQGMSPPAGEPCQEINVSGLGANGNTDTMVAGHTYDYTLQYQGPKVSEFAVDPEDEGSSQQTVSFGPQLVHQDATISPAQNQPVPGVPNMWTSTVTMTPAVGGPAGVQIYCMDTTGNVWLFGGGASGGVPAGSGLSTTCTGGQTSTPVGCTADLGACFSDAGAQLSLDNPASWVGAIIDGTGCLLQWAFVPASFDTSAMSSPITQHAPYSYVADGVSAANTLVAGVNSGISSGACAAPSIGANFSALQHIGNVSTFSVSLPAPQSLGCTDAAGSYAASGKSVGDLFGYRTLIRDVMSLGVWSAALIAALYMTPWTRSWVQGGLQWLSWDRGSGLNEDGDSIASYWTGEGSG